MSKLFFWQEYGRRTDVFKYESFSKNTGILHQYVEHLHKRVQFQHETPANDGTSSLSQVSNVQHTKGMPTSSASRVCTQRCRLRLVRMQGARVLATPLDGFENRGRRGWHVCMATLGCTHWQILGLPHFRTPACIMMQTLCDQRLRLQARHPEQCNVAVGISQKRRPSCRYKGM